ncbi:hypothetical protein [Lactococcus taiwanensis]|uniref:hypothetical protein n=1 Tax=Lactococcus taiwanensis TaxID=1151742 RepID=UPI003514C161
MQESTDILVGENTVANINLVVYDTGGLDVQFTISDPQKFHETADATTDLNEVITQALTTSKGKISAYY